MSESNENVLNVGSENKIIARYTSIEAGLSDLKERHLNVVVDVTTLHGMKAAKEGRAELKRVRLNLEAARVEEKAESLAYGKLVDAEALRIRSILEPMEMAYDRAIKIEDQRKMDIVIAAAREEARIKVEAEAKIQAEKDRIELEERKKFEAQKELLRQQEVAFENKQREAAEVQAKIEHEKKLAQEKIDQEERERKAKIEAEEKASRDRIEATERESRLKIENEQRALREKSEIIERQKRFEIERGLSEARTKKETEEKIAKQKNEELIAIEKQKQQEINEKNKARELRKQLQLDGVEMLKVFSQKYGSNEMFEVINAQVIEFLASLK